MKKQKVLILQCMCISVCVCMCVCIYIYIQPLYEELRAADELLQLSKGQEISRICIANLEANALEWEKKQKENKREE